MKEKLQKIREEAIRQIEGSDELGKLNDVRVAFLGKKGELTAVLKGMKDVSPEELTQRHLSSRTRKRNWKRPERDWKKRNWNFV